MNRTLVSKVGILAASLVAAAAPALAGADKPRVALVEIEGAPLEAPSPFAWLVGEDADPTLGDIVRTLEGVADDNADTVLIRLKDAQLNRTQIEEIGAAMKGLREAGKKVRVFADAYGPAELALGAYADEVIGQAGSGVQFHGIYMEEMFLADTLSWLGVKADFVQVGDYKGANEMFMNNAPSPAWEENISQLLDSIYANLRTSIKEGRGLNDAQLDAAMRDAWLGTAADAAKVGLIDTVVDLPDLGEHLSGQDGGSVVWIERKPKPKGASQIDTSNPFAVFSILTKKPKHDPSGPTIAVVNITGTIVDGESDAGGLFGGGGTVGSRTIRNALETILAEDDIKGVVIRVDSPGGSATASEVMWQGIRRVAKKKPVWVSVGSMAASGGYYVSVAGDKIYVNPSSIVGSIGVVGGKFSMGGLYDTLKIRVTPRSRGPMADMFDSTKPWTPEQVQMVRSRMTDIYDLFASRVRAGRPGIDLSRTAEGRLFTGDKAIGLRMADKIGGLDAAIDDLAAELGLSDFDVMHYPGPKGFDELIESAFSIRSPGVHAGGVPSDAVLALRAAVGERAWPAVADALNGIFQLRNEPVLLTMPRALIFH